MNFQTFFGAATGHERPHDYQRRPACSERARDEAELDWLDHGVACESWLISIHTGLGNNAAVVLARLWNRVALDRPHSPRRLVYCLAMLMLLANKAGVELSVGRETNRPWPTDIRL